MNPTQPVQDDAAYYKAEAQKAFKSRDSLKEQARAHEARIVRLRSEVARLLAALLRMERDLEEQS